MKRKGVILVVAMVVLSIVLTLTGVYFSSLITEKKSADTEKSVLQALAFAEAGANHAVSELRKRIRTDLNANVRAVAQSSIINNYFTNNDSLGFLRDFAVSPGQLQWMVSGSGTAALNISPMNLNTIAQGGYSAVITVIPDGNPSNPSNDIFIFPYGYSIDAVGISTATVPNVRKNIRLLNGNFSITVRRDNFAKFALFTAHHMTPSGTTVWFTSSTNFTGPVSTNGRFSFAQNPSGHFTEDVTQHEIKARFYNNGWSVLLDAENNGTIDVPVFDKAFTRGESIINLESSVSQADLKHQALGGTADPGAQGIYVPNDGTNLIGGIYIKSNTGNISVAMSTDASDNAVYNIAWGSCVKTITVDYADNLTTVTACGGGSSVTYNGIPDGVSNEGILIYANNDILSFSGTVQSDANVTVSSEKDIVITDNVAYQDYNAGPPPDATGYNNILGILSWGGDVRIGTAAPNNVNIHGVVMAPHGVFRVDDYNVGSPRGTATLLGGVITDFYGPFGTFSGSLPVSGYGRNFVYDQRVLQGITPPFFPYLSNFISSDDLGIDQPLDWQDKGG